VAFDEEDKDARLSLRQTEILHKLSNICDKLPNGPGNRSARHCPSVCRHCLLMIRMMTTSLAMAIQQMLTRCATVSSLSFTPSMEGSCSSPHQESPTMAQ